jgi:hypothetical protein
MFGLIRSQCRRYDRKDTLGLACSWVQWVLWLASQGFDIAGGCSDVTAHAASWTEFTHFPHGFGTEKTRTLAAKLSHYHLHNLSGDLVLKLRKWFNSSSSLRARSRISHATLRHPSSHRGAWQ